MMKEAANRGGLPLLTARAMASALRACTSEISWSISSPSSMRLMRNTVDNVTRHSPGRYPALAKLSNYIETSARFQN